MRLVRISLFPISCIKINPKQLSELRGTDFPEGTTFKGMSELSRGSEQAGKSLKDSHRQESCREKAGGNMRGLTDPLEP